MTNEALTIGATLGVLGILAAAQGCPPPAPPPSLDGAIVIALDAGVDATVADCQAACDAIGRVGCVVQADCARVICASNADPRLPHFDTACLIRALVPGDIAKCGVSCVTP